MGLKDLYIDRVTFGTDAIPYRSLFIKWRFSDILYAAVIYTLDWFYFEKIEPYQRQFFINDLTISHPFAKVERVSGAACILIAFWIPAITIFTVNLLFTPKRHKFYILFVSILGLCISIGTTTFLTDIGKNWIGRCRPDFLARCIPKKTAIKNTLYFAKDICTQTDTKKLLDGFRTTPSGHSSISFAGLGYLTLWLSGQLMVSRIHGGAWRSIVALLPCLLAGYIALSRTQDYRHHFVDVLLGSTLGSLVAWWSYRRLFPTIASEVCYVPYVIIDEKTNKYSDTSSNFYESGDNYMMASNPSDLESADIRSTI
ncbi:hypothetical protein B5S31_g4954 [[Candida] boidinii]|uniref:Unnamed protein product n=1 Tax=Candida boidinii TaxID=5477 RepID=A0ACB5TY44_CANBO|nr:hypothetical protein B5S29_g2659 [[Candida] boidinii]OWB75100.1 hypothetical protein B5S31_g4954 [[Candida] boidinii]OWB80081.1 hypothetical protein B5S32_g4331 [[Candida] boidinii]GME97688.1 unnamed protein product [[Candida] boidinii]